MPGAPASSWPPAGPRTVAPGPGPRTVAPGPGRPRGRRPRTMRAPARCAASLLPGALLQPVLEAAIEVGIDRQLVAEQLGVDLLELGGALVLLPGVDRRHGERERQERREQAQRHAAPAAEAAEQVVGPGEACGGLGALALERAQA